MTLKEKLEDECQSFQALAMSAGISRTDSTRPAGEARTVAETLLKCPAADEAKQRMQQNRNGTQAFWQVMEIVLTGVRAGKIRVGVPSMQATGPLCVLACTVMEYCETLDERFPDQF